MQKYKTINSFTQRPSVAQIIAYLLFTMQIVLFAAIIQKHYKSNAKRIGIIVVYSILLFVHILATFLTSCSDPSDDFMIRYKNDRESVKNEAIGFMLYCDLCRSYVKKTSKHCRQCKRCVEGFDHHCMWINNCIGSKNYKIFLIMLGLTFVSMLTYLISMALLWSQGRVHQFMAQMGVIWASAIIILVFNILVLNLILFHIYLNYLGLTTYDFLVQEKSKTQTRKLSNGPQQNVTNEAILAENSNSVEISQLNLMQANTKKQKQNLNTSTNKVSYKSEEKSQKQGTNQIHLKTTCLGQFNSKKVHPSNFEASSQQKIEENIFDNDHQTVKTQQNQKESSRISDYFAASKSIKMLISNEVVKPSQGKIQKAMPISRSNYREQNLTQLKKNRKTINRQEILEKNITF